MLQTLRPDPTFHPSARLAMEAPPERIAYTALLSRDRSRPDALASLLAGLGIAWIVYRYLGLRALRSAWLNLDAVWGASLMLAGAAGIASGF